MLQTAVRVVKLLFKQGTERFVLSFHRTCKLFEDLRSTILKIPAEVSRRLDARHLLLNNALQSGSAAAAQLVCALIGGCKS